MFQNGFERGFASFVQLCINLNLQNVFIKISIKNVFI